MDKGIFSKISYPWNDLIQKKYDLLQLKDYNGNNPKSTHAIGFLKKAFMDTLKEVCQQTKANKHRRKHILRSKLGQAYYPKYDEDINIKFGCLPQYPQWKSSKK